LTKPKLLIIIPLILLLFFVAQRLLTPKYMTGTYDGALTAEYYSAPKNNQVLFIGDCEVYENFSPVTLFDKYGITSYIRGGAQQLIWHSYYLLEDTLRYETPDMVVFNVLSMKYGEPQTEAYNRLNLEGLEPTLIKLRAVLAAKMPDEDSLSYFVPILRYHERWKEVGAEDFEYFFDTKDVGFAGYLLRSVVKPVDFTPPPPKLPDYTLPAVCVEYLDKMRELCDKHGITFILIKAPTLWPHWYDQWEEQIEAYAQSNSLAYINFLEHVEDIGLDFETDTSDAGLHLNVTGAEKLAGYFGAWLKGHYDLPDMREDAEARSYWNGLKAAYEDVKSQQLAEIAVDGKESTYIH
jgi:hypothetical protein